jgi:hypothetical protein
VGDALKAAYNEQGREAMLNVLAQATQNVPLILEQNRSR